MRCLALALLLDSQVDVGPVDSRQGRESDVVIISTVRSRHQSEWQSTDDKFQLGFISNPRRINAAMTRASKLLVIVGDSNCLGLSMYVARL
jgi:superfamily I DNA and/or RNA helicase